MKINNKMKHNTNNIVRKNHKQKELNAYVNSCILIGDKLQRLRKVIGEDISISMITDKGEFIISELETLRALKLKQKLQYSGEDDYDDSEPTAWQRGIL